MIYFRSRKVLGELLARLPINQRRWRAFNQPQFRPAPKQGVSPGLALAAVNRILECQSANDRTSQSVVSGASVSISLIGLVCDGAVPLQRSRQGCRIEARSRNLQQRAWNRILPAVRVLVGPGTMNIFSGESPVLLLIYLESQDSWSKAALSSTSGNLVLSPSTWNRPLTQNFSAKVKDLALTSPAANDLLQRQGSNMGYY